MRSAAATVAVLVALLGAAAALPALPAAPPVAAEDNEVGGRAAEGGWALLAHIVDECADAEPAVCLGAKAVTALRRAARLAAVPLADGVAFVRTAAAADDDKAGRALPAEEDVKRALEEEPQDKTSRLLDLMVDAVARFFSTHSLQFSLPQAAQRALQEEGRGKKKMLKMLLPILLGVGGKLLLLIPLGIGVVGLLAVKALLTSKLALLLAGAFAAQKLISGGGLSGFGKNGWGSGGSGWSSGGTGWTSGGSGGAGWSSGPASAGSSGWSRSMDAHDLAYSAQAPQPAAPAQ